MTADHPFDQGPGEHICAAWGCDRVVAELEFMCPKHWPLIPDQAVHAIFQAYAPKGVKKMSIAAVREKEVTKIVV